MHDVIKAPTSFSASRLPASSTVDDLRSMANRPDRFRDGQSDPRNHARGSRSARGGHGDRSLRLSKPDQ